MPPRTKQSTFALAILIVLGGLYYLGSQAAVPPAGYVAGEDKNSVRIYSVSDIKTGGTASSTYLTEAYVIGKYECPACPKDVNCHACLTRESAIVVDSASLSAAQSPLGPNQLLVFTDSAKFLRLGQKYRLAIQLEPSATDADHKLDARVVDYQSLAE